MKHLFAAAIVFTSVAVPVSATAQASSPLAVVRSAYTCVFSKSCPESTARSYLTPSFARDFAAVDALEKRCRCEVIDASPWIDSQTGPATFSAGAATVEKDSATVPVHFSGGKTGSYSLTVDLARTATGWAISDIHQRDGKSTAAMMAANVERENQTVTTPDGVLREFERWYNAATMRRSLAASFSGAKPFLSAAFARNVEPKLAQSIDPFTLSSARVTDWESQKAKVAGDTATAVVRLQFAGGEHSKVLYHLQRVAGRWTIGGVTKCYCGS